MTIRIGERPMSTAERAYLEDLLRGSATTLRRWKEGAENAIVLWSVSMMGVLLVWAFLAWLARALFHWKIDWSDSPLAFWVFAVAALACAVLAVVSSVRWIRGWRDSRPALGADLEGGRVVDERYQLVAAKRFQEPHHGGIFYFLRTSDDKVLVLFDHESQELAVNDKDPMSSTFQPRTDLLMVRAPDTTFVIRKEFSGAPLVPGELHDMDEALEKWPEDESLCNIPWDDLEGHFSASVPSPVT